MSVLFSPLDVRSAFPALAGPKGAGHAPVFFDGPGGTQVPQVVIDAIGAYLKGGNANLLDSPFYAVRATHEVLARARDAARWFVNAQSPGEIVFGGNMTTLTAHVSRAIARTWQAADEIIVTDLDHFSNVSFWQQAAEERGVVVKTVPLRLEDCTLDMDAYARLLSPRTRLVAFSLASNVSGSKSNAQDMVRMARQVGALTYCDSVHYAPHFLPDVKLLDCDFLACSAYKFFGPHLGFVYGRADHLSRIRPYKVEPASDIAPESWETGTKSFEALSGFIAAVEYIASLSLLDPERPLRERLLVSYERVAAYERQWSAAFLDRAAAFKGMRIHGITDKSRLGDRTSTFSMSIDGFAPSTLSKSLAERNISAGAGNFYAKGMIDALGLAGQGGALRAGCVHYNTLEEIDVFFNALEQVVRS